MNINGIDLNVSNMGIPFRYTEVDERIKLSDKSLDPFIKIV